MKEPNYNTNNPNWKNLKNHNESKERSKPMNKHHLIYISSVSIACLLSVFVGGLLVFQPLSPIQKTYTESITSIPIHQLSKVYRPISVQAIINDYKDRCINFSPSLIGK